MHIAGSVVGAHEFYMFIFEIAGRVVPMRFPLGEVSRKSLDGRLTLEETGFRDFVWFDGKALR